MLSIVIIVIFIVYLVFAYPYIQLRSTPDVPKIRDSAQMKQLWQIAQTSIKERKTLRAEKALLTILRFDEKNASAYNRLGILYAKERKWDDAIECFEIAQSLENNASSLHNVGLVYLETENYDKASQAFHQAITLEGDIPTRYIAYAKAEEKLGRQDKALESLETAFSLDPSTTILRHILELHESTNNTEAIKEVKARIAKIIEDKRTIKRSPRRPIRRQPKLSSPKPSTNPNLFKKRKFF